MNNQINDLEELPRALIEDLKAREDRVPVLTARVDRQIDAEAADRFGQRRTTRPLRRPAWVAAAASVLIAVLLLSPYLLRDDAATADYDNSGRVDIADVLYLAQQGQSDERSQQEIDALAMQIVSLANWEDAS